MAVPRNRHSNARKKTKRAHHALSPTRLIKCGNCGASRLHHAACSSCGTYDDKRSLSVSAGEE